MSDFKTAYPDLATLDPYKRVNYTTGLVLGVDEFLQEELYLLEKYHLHDRTLHGYGTVCGLAVSWKPTAGGPKLIVAPGVAINPRGQVIRVPQSQCALLNDWLVRNKDKDAVKEVFGSPPQTLRIHLNLCHDECRTDLVPIPSGPCISLEDSSAPSRIADTFELKLDIDPPSHLKEKQMEEFIDLLHGIEITDAPGDFIERDQLESLVRGLKKLTSPPVTSPPTPMRMRSTDVREFMRAAFRIWVTEVKPELLEARRDCAGGLPPEDCVLLAEIEFDIEEDGSFVHVSGDVTIDETERPILLNTRLFQEYMTIEGLGRQ